MILHIDAKQEVVCISQHLAFHRAFSSGNASSSAQVVQFILTRIHKTLVLWHITIVLYIFVAGPLRTNHVIHEPSFTLILIKINILSHLILQLFEHEGHWLTMEVSWWWGHWCINVCMSINPDEAQVRTLLGMTSHRSNTQAVNGEFTTGI